MKLPVDTPLASKGGKKGPEKNSPKPLQAIFEASLKSATQSDQHFPRYLASYKITLLLYEIKQFIH